MITSVGKPIWWYAVMSLIMFGFIFDFYFYSFGIPVFVTSSRFSAIVITMMALYKTAIKHENKKRFMGEPEKAIRSFCRFHVPVIIYMLLLYTFIGFQGDSKHMLFILLRFFMFRIIPIWSFFVIFDSMEELMKVIIIAVLTQTVIIWFCITNPIYKSIIDNNFNLSDRYINSSDSYAGGLGCITSQGLIRYALGEIACVYMFFRKNNISYIILFSLMALTGSMIARTGVVIAIICALFISYYVIKIVRFSYVITFVSSVLLTIFLAYAVISSNTSRSFLENRFVRLETLYEETKYADDIHDIGFFDNYLNGERRVVPDISIKTIIGTGVPSGISGNGVKVNVDGGYLRLYVAYGLLLSIIFYVFFLSTTLKVCFSFKHKEEKYCLLLMLSLIIVGEFKEWNIYSSCHLTMFFLMALLLKYDSIKNKWISLQGGKDYYDTIDRINRRIYV